MPTQFRKYNFNETGDKHCLYLPPKPKFGKEAYAPEPLDIENPLLKPNMKYIQRVVGSLLFYGRVSDATILKVINFLSQQQSKPTTITINRVNHLLCYLCTHPRAGICYKVSQMIL